MDKGKYKEFLKDGRWQRKRLEIMQRDDFKCKQCGATNDLQVHHLRYFNGRKPWEYSNEDLVTLCGKCHSLAHEFPEESLDYFRTKEWEQKYKGLLLYYEQAWEYDNGVITMIMCDEEFHNNSCYCPFYMTDMLPDYYPNDFASAFAGGCYDIGYANCSMIWLSIVGRTPDKVFTKEQFDNFRRGREIEREDYIIDNTDEFLDRCIKFAEQRYK